MAFESLLELVKCCISIGADSIWNMIFLVLITTYICHQVTMEKMVFSRQFLTGHLTFLR